MKILHMRRKEIRAFQILEELKTNQATSQRRLARKLNVSLGLMNAVLKDLESQGLFVLEPLNGNRKRYTLTPRGVTENNRLTCEYVKHSLYHYGITRRRIAKLLRALENNGIFQIAFCGISYLAEIAYVCLSETQISLNAMIENDSQYDLYFGVPVIAMSEAQRCRFDNVLITCTDAVDNVVERLHSHGVDRENITLLFK